jgi:hypothetical protein
LEGCGGVGELKEHNLWFEQSLIGSESCLPLISFLDLDVVVSLSYIEF